MWIPPPALLLAAPWPAQSLGLVPADPGTSVGLEGGACATESMGQARVRILLLILSSSVPLGKTLSHSELDWAHFLNEVNNTSLVGYL